MRYFEICPSVPKMGTDGHPVTKVTTGHQKWPKMGQNSIRSSFFARRAKKASAEGRSPPQELEVGPRSGPYLLVYIKVKTQMLKKYNIAAKKSKFDRRGILLKSVCSSVPAKNLGHGHFFLFYFLHIREFLMSGQILHTSTDCLQLRWPLCVSEKGCTFFLQLFE